jgi:hypothetical protein
MPANSSYLIAWPIRPRYAISFVVMDSRGRQRFAAVQRQAESIAVNVVAKTLRAIS